MATEQEGTGKFVDWFLTYAYGESYKTVIPTVYIDIAETNRPDRAKIRDRRVIGLVILAYLLIIQVYLYGFEIFQYLTSTGLLFTFMTILLTHISAQDPDISSKTLWLAILHILNEFVILVELLIVTMYWIIIHADQIGTLEGIAWL